MWVVLQELEVAFDVSLLVVGEGTGEAAAGLDIWSYHYCVLDTGSLLHNIILVLERGFEVDSSELEYIRHNSSDRATTELYEGAVARPPHSADALAMFLHHLNVALDGHVRTHHRVVATCENSVCRYVLPHLGRSQAIALFEFGTYLGCRFECN